MFNSTHDIILLALATLYALAFVARLAYKSRYPMPAAFISIALVVTAILW